MPMFYKAAIVLRFITAQQNLFYNYNRHFGIVYNVVAYTAKQQFFNAGKTSGTHNNHIGSGFFGCAQNHFMPAAPVEKAVPVETYTTKPDAKLSEVVMLFNPAKLERVKDAMNAVGVTGMTVTNVMGCGTQKGHVRKYRGVEIEELNLNPKMKLEMVISAVPVETVIAAAREALYTGNIGDGKIFVYDVEDAVKVRTGARGYDALQGTDD